jgi:four helix bundle suffix protein
MTGIVAKHGGYKNLLSFQTAEIIYDLTFEFCNKYVTSLKQREQMEGAARGGKQNIAEGSATSGTSKQSELRLMQVARASQEELKNDYLDFLRTRHLTVWTKDNPRTVEIRQLGYRSNRTYRTYMTYMSEPENAANCLLCLINQACFLLDQQLRALEKGLKENGDYKERYKQLRGEELKKQIFGSQEDDLEFLKSQGLRRLENGRVVEINSPEQ